MSTDLARKTAELANRDVGERETDGSNDSPRVRQYQQTVGLKPGDPYCAAAVSTWVKEATQELHTTTTFKKSGSALGLLKNNFDHTFQKLTEDDVPCVAIYRHSDGIHGHALLAVGYDPDTGKFQSIEANSNGAGSREGQGVYALDIRNVNDQQLAGFIRIA